MGKLLKELFEKYAKRLLTNKVRPSISEEGIMTIPNKQRVEKMAQSLYEDFKKAGVPDNILKTENDIKVFHHKIAEINNENIVKQFDTLMSESTLFNPKKSADIFDLKGNKVKNPNNIMGGEEIIETEADILTRLKKGNKESLSNMRYENAVKAEKAKAAADEDYIMKVLDPEDFSKGGRAGYYGGGQAMVGEDLSEIGHGSDSLMARNMQLAPNSMATTSTGLNYLLGQDNDTARVPYKEKGSVTLADLIKVNASGSKSGKNQIMGAPKGITADSETFNAIIKMDIPLSKKIDLLGSYGYGKDRFKVEKDNKELFLGEGGYKDRNIGIGVNQGGEGFSGSVMRNLETGDDDYQLKFLKSFAEGGRIGYNKGKAVKKVVDEGRRGFMKAAGAAGAGIAALKTGLLGFGEKVAPVAKEAVEAVSNTAGQVPPYFWKLVEKIKNLGDDAPRLAVKDREKVTTYKEYTLTEDVTTGEQTIERMKVTDPDSASYYGQPLTEETYMNYRPGKGLADETTKGKTPIDEYEEGTAYIRSDRMNAGEVVEESAGVSDEIYEEVGEAIPEVIRKTKADGGRIGYNKGKVVEKLIKAGEGAFTKAQYLIERIKNTIKGSPDDKYVQETFPNFIKELEANPDLAKNENVFKELGGDLPEGQQIVVYGDDTLDFFTTSSGPQNIKKLENFMAKHDLPKDQALRIMKMEPNDQVMELTKTKFLKQKRTDNSSGGLAAMLGE